MKFKDLMHHFKYKKKHNTIFIYSVTDKNLKTDYNVKQRHFFTRNIKLFSHYAWRFMVMFIH